MLALLCLALLPAACLAAPPPLQGCESCHLNYQPVCKDGIEYQNECLARCQGVKGAKKGSCLGPAADAVAVAAARENAERYNTAGTVSWEEMRKMNSQGYHLTGRAVLQAFDKDNLGKGGKSDPLSHPSQRRHVAVTFPKGNTYTKLTVDAAPGNETNSSPSFTPSGTAVADVSGKPQKSNRRSLYVIGADNRVQITWDAYPYRAGARLTFGEGGHCSAAMIGPQIAVTAGHCVYDRDTRRWYNLGGMRLTPGVRSGGVANFGSTGVSKAVTYTAWTNNGLWRYDIAVLYLSSPIGRKTGWFGIGYKCGAATYDLQKVGYPGDKAARTMWWATCRVYKDFCQESELINNCDITPGDSGSGMWTGSDKQVRSVVSYQSRRSDGSKFNGASTVRPNTWSIFRDAFATTPRS